MRPSFNAFFVCWRNRQARDCFVLLILIIPYHAAFALGPSVQPGSAATGLRGGGGAAQAGSSGLQPWTVKPSVELGETYVKISGTSGRRQPGGYYVTEANPQLSITGRSPRARLKLNYRMQNIFYATHTEADTTYHQLNASGNATLVSNLLFVNAASRMSQQIISPTSRIYLGNFAATSNRTDVRTYSLSPYVHYKFGTTATTILRYMRRASFYSKAGRYGNSANLYSVSVQSGPSFGRLSWGLNASREKVTYNSYPGVSFESAQAQLGWLLSRSLTVTATGGYMKNHYVSINRHTQGKSWSVGFVWSPGLHTSLSASYGRRYYGNVYFLRFNHRSRYTRWSARYSVAASTINYFQHSSAVGGLINPSGQVSLVNFLLPNLTQQVYISKRGSLSVARQFRAGSANITVYGRQRDYQQSGEHRYYYGTRDSISRKIGRRSTVTVHGAWVRYHYRTRSTFDYWYAGMDFSHQLGRRITGNLRYLYSLHSGNEGTGKYSEQVASVFITMKF